MASTEDNAMGEEVVAPDQSAHSSVKRLHSSHDSGMESECDEYSFGWKEPKLVRLVCVWKDTNRSLFNMYLLELLTHSIPLPTLFLYRFRVAFQERQL